MRLVVLVAKARTARFTIAMVRERLTETRETPMLPDGLVPDRLVQRA